MQDMKARSVLGPDAWSLALLAGLSRQGMEAPADLINAIEKEVALARQFLHVWCVLLRKPSAKIEPGEERPIGLLPMLVRIWERIRRPELANMCQQRGTPGCSRGQHLGLEGHHPVHGPG